MYHIDKTLIIMAIYISSVSATWWHCVHQTHIKYHAKTILLMRHFRLKNEITVQSKYGGALLRPKSQNMTAANLRRQAGDFRLSLPVDLQDGDRDEVWGFGKSNKS